MRASCLIWRGQAAAQFILAAVLALCALAMPLGLAARRIARPALSSAGFHLQLSGHTHGGQFYPWNLFVRFQQPFTTGLRKWEKLWVYTSRGTGC